MKFVKSISLFFVIAILLFGLGFILGGSFSNFFYPERKDPIEQFQPVKERKEFRKTAEAEEQRINADTRLLVEEADLRRDSLVETQWELPAKYIGMDREEFLKAMEDYELSPPLTELERGFVSLEVKSFSSERILVRMNYTYTAPTSSFYLMAANHSVIVYCEDKKTIYMKTNILLDSLPDELQQRVIAGMYVEDEKTLYDFLESYSS